MMPSGQIMVTNSYTIQPIPEQQMNNLNRDSLIQDYAQQLLDGMDYKTMECFVYDTLVSNLESYTDIDLVNEVKEYSPELLEECNDDVPDVEVAQ